MFYRLSESQNALYKYIDALLWEEWDPIGVNDGEEWPRDEYQSYAMPLFSSVLRKANIKEICSQLSQVERTMFVLEPNESLNLTIAEKIIKKAQELSLG
jgi:hypothetical protein